MVCFNIPEVIKLDRPYEEDYVKEFSDGKDLNLFISKEVMGCKKYGRCEIFSEGDKTAFS